MRLARALALLAAVGCGGAGSRAQGAAAGGVRAYVQALRADDPRAAYSMLSDDARRDLPFELFAAQWRESAVERRRQADALADALKGQPDLGERARVTYVDGKTVHLMREQERWRLEAALVSRVTARRPHDAVKIFAGALEKKHYGQVLRILTAERRESIAREVDDFTTGLIEHQNDQLTESGDRAELIWEHNGATYKIVLKREDEEWRVDSVDKRPSPPPAP